MFSSRELEVLRTMEEMGGSFVSHLAMAWVRADSSNHQRLKVAFPEYWDEYERMVERLKERKKEDGK